MVIKVKVALAYTFCTEVVVTFHPSLLFLRALYLSDKSSVSLTSS